jgi:hypothetical protein
MLALRYIALAALVVWIGGLLALGAIAAPVIFSVIDARHVADGRLLAGAIFGTILGRFELVEYASGAVLLAALGMRRVLGPRPRHFGLRLAIAVIMLASAGYAGLVVTGEIEAVQARMGGVAPSSLSENDPRRVEFGRLHGLSSGLQLIPLLGGLALMFFELNG